MATMTREWGKEEGEDVEAEAAVVASTTATAEMPTIRLALLHQSTQLSQSRPQAPACRMAQEGLPWAEGSRSTLPQMLHLSQMLRLSQMLPSGVTMWWLILLVISRTNHDSDPFLRF